MKIIHITDTHIRPEGERVFGLDPVARLASVIASINDRHADADLAVVTGDLADAGDRWAYEILRESLAALRLPYRLMLGNHDRRADFRAVFADHPVDGHGFVQSTLDAPGRIGRLLFLDSLEEGRIGGHFCQKRLGWIADRLAEASDRPVLVFMHHPPLPVGVAHFAYICMAEPTPFLDLLQGHPGGVRQLVFGHIHIPLSGIYPGGIPFTAGRGCNHQIALDFADRGADWAAGQPNYGVIVAEEDALFVHSFDLVDAAVMGRGQPCAGP